MSAAIDIAFFRRKLLEMQDELLELEQIGKSSAETVQLDQTRVGRLSRMDALQSQAMSQAANNRRQQELLAIKAALSRLDNDEFGECPDCAEPIDPQRLELNPTVLRCIHCAAEQE